MQFSPCRIITSDGRKTTKLQTKNLILVLFILLQRHSAAYSNLVDHVKLHH